MFYLTEAPAAAKMRLQIDIIQEKLFITLSPGQMNALPAGAPVERPFF